MSSAEDIESKEVAAIPVVWVGDGEINQQVATAHRYPRSITRFLKEAETMACQTEEIAASCFYKLPRGGKEIEGPGVRLAEIVVSAWGNIRAGSRIVEEGQDFIVAEGMCHDLEKNVATAIQVRRRITDKFGKRYNADMILVTANAASAIAFRNAVFRVIPRSYVEPIYEKAKQVAIGDASTLNARRQTAIGYFAKMGVSEAQILAKLQKVGVDDIDLKDMEILVGLKTALKDGELQVDQAFPPLTPANAGASKTDSLAANLKNKAGAQEPGAKG